MRGVRSHSGTRLTRATAVVLAGGVAIALGAVLPWYAAAGTDASADAYAAGRGVLGTGLLGIGVIIAAAALTRQQLAWAATLAGAAAAIPLGVMAAGGTGDGMRRAGFTMEQMPLGSHPGLGINLMFGGVVVAVAGALLMWRESRREAF